MLYAWDITVPANTLQADPLEQLLKLTHGVITKVSVKYPAGCHGLVQVRLLHEESPLVPLNKDTWLTADDEAVETPEYFELDTQPFALKFVGVNNDDTYPHTITVRITVLPKAVAALTPVFAVIERLSRRIFGE